MVAAARCTAFGKDFSITVIGAGAVLSNVVAVVVVMAAGPALTLALRMRVLQVLFMMCCLVGMFFVAVMMATLRVLMIVVMLMTITFVVVDATRCWLCFFCTIITAGFTTFKTLTSINSSNTTARFTFAGCRSTS